MIKTVKQACRFNPIIKDYSERDHNNRCAAFQVI